MLLAGSAIADTFYLQGDLPLNPDPDANDSSWWYDAPTGGSQMPASTPFSGNRFDLNGYTFKNFYTNHTGTGSSFIFEGTLVRDNVADGNIFMYATPAHLAGVDWTADGERTKAFVMRQSDAEITITNLNVDALMIVRANSSELNLDLTVPTLTGGGTIEFGTDAEEAPGVWGLDIDNSAFTGTISIAVGNLRIDDALVLTHADLSVASAFSEVILDNNASFNTAVYGGTMIPAGTYTAAQLNSLLLTGNFSGPGTLTVLTDNIVPPETFYLHADKSRDDSDTIKTVWFDDPSGGTDMDTLGDDFAGNRYDLNGYRYSTKNNTSSQQSFGGTMVISTNRLSLYSKMFDLAGLEWNAAGERGSSEVSLHKDDITWNVGSLSVSNKMLVRVNSDEKNLDLTVNALTGDGTITFGADNSETEDGNSVWGLDVDYSAFTGTIELNVGILRFNDTLSLSNATLTVQAGSQITSVVLSNSATFGGMKYGASTVPVGTYTAAQLNSEFATDRFSGTGSITVLTDITQTFYLQADKPKGNAGHYESEQKFWWDDPTAGNNMTNVADAVFAGNRFELNGLDYNTWDGSSSLDVKRRFAGTLVKGNETIQKWAHNWVLAGLHVTSESALGGKGIRIRDSGKTLTVENFQLDGALRIQANNDEQNLDTTIQNLKGAGTLSFGDDNTAGEDGDSIWGLDVDNSAFTGTIEINVGNLRFDDDLVLTNATLVVQGGSQLTAVILSNAAAFAAMDYDGSPVADGEYSADDLNTLLSTDRFSGDGILTVGEVVVETDPYADWLALYPTLGSQTNLTDDAEPDGLNNLLEYALGGNPTNDDAAAALPVSEADAGWLTLVYGKRADADDVGLTYTVVTDTDLVHGQMTNEVPEYGVSDLAINGYVTATNRIPTDTDNQAFMQLKVELD